MNEDIPFNGTFIKLIIFRNDNIFRIKNPDANKANMTKTNLFA